MRPPIERHPSSNAPRRTLSTCLALALAVASNPAPGQAPAPRSDPRLPGAVEKAPAWLKGAPFDVAAFFKMPPASENAAPLYLDALFEFEGDLESCFPPDQRDRAAATRARGDRMKPINAAWDKDPKSVGPTQVDGVLTEFKEGFRKLDLAQRRQRCVFPIGLSPDSSIEFVTASRTVARLTKMQVARALDRDEFDGAFGSVSRLLRLGRDLRPRGTVICQLVSIAIDRYCVDLIGQPLLEYRKLKVAHCDRLIKLLAAHESQALDPLAAGLKGEYVMLRATFRTFEDGVKTTYVDGRPIEAKLDGPAREREIAQLLRLIGTDSDAAKIDPLKLVEPQALARDRRVIDDVVRVLLAAPSTFPGRILKLKELSNTLGQDQSPSLAKFVFADTAPFVSACSTDAACLGATQCLIALRRWQLTHNTPPTDLAAVCREAGMPGVPVDPFSGSPLRLAIVSGEPVVYSVGEDGRDDRALKDADLGRKPGTEGDYLFRLPKRR